MRKEEILLTKPAEEKLLRENGTILCWHKPHELKRQEGDKLQNWPRKAGPGNRPAETLCESVIQQLPSGNPGQVVELENPTESLKNRHRPFPSSFQREQRRRHCPTVPCGQKQPDLQPGRSSAGSADRHSSPRSQTLPAQHQGVQFQRGKRAETWPPGILPETQGWLKGRNHLWPPATDQPLGNQRPFHWGYFPPTSWRSAAQGCSQLHEAQMCLQSACLNLLLPSGLWLAALPSTERPPCAPSAPLSVPSTPSPSLQLLTNPVTVGPAVVLFCVGSIKPGGPVVYGFIKCGNAGPVVGPPIFLSLPPLRPLVWSRA